MDNNDNDSWALVGFVILCVCAGFLFWMCWTTHQVVKHIVS